MLSAEHPAHIARLPNGVRLAYDVAGVGTPLIFIHGVMGDWRSWAAQWPAFMPRFRCISYSRRYNFPNANAMPSPHHSALDEAVDLRLLMDALGLEKAILVGSSYGSFTALALAAQHPQRCIALALSEPPMLKYAALSAAGNAAEAAFRRDVIEPANAAFRRGEDELAARIMTGGISGVPQAQLSPAAMQQRMQSVAAMKMLAMSTDEFPWIAPETLAALSMPVLLMAGERSPPIHSETFANICAAMPQARCKRIPNAGHATSRDNAESFNALVLEFLKPFTSPSPIHR